MSDTIARLNAALEGRYTLERELGEGGMATVYLAHDERHDRPVAVKVLRPELAAVLGAERFLAEIKTTANLQHPHILPLFDSGEADSFLFYVMPYVEGESLRDRLDREHQLPVDDAVQIARNLAEALDYAHGERVIHRDIKPANVLLLQGKPVISDFGIALAVGAAGGGRLTETGLSLGTPHYMSPEQATGDQTVGPTTDIYALGCVLYEMLVGDPPYVGSTAQAILGKIITASPDPVTQHRKAVPANVEATIARALEKLPADRFAGAGDLAKALADPAFRHGGDAITGVTAARGPWNRLTMTAVSAALALALGWSLLSRPEEPTNPVIRFTVPVGEGAEVFLGGEADARYGRPSATSLAISPDGGLLVYSAWEVNSDGDEVSRLYSRRLEQERADPIEGTEGASSPFFSPDGDWAGFFVGPSLRRVSMVDGTTETVVSDAEVWPWGPSGTTWGDDGTIVYGGRNGLYSVSASGGDVDLVVEVDTLVAGGFRPLQPHMLPGSGNLLFSGSPATLDRAQAGLYALDLATGTRTSLLTNAMDPRYVETGHLLFMRQGTLMAVGFDPDRVEIVGEPVIVLEDVMQAVGMPNAGWESGAAQVAVSPAGHIAYARGGVFPSRHSVLMRVTFDGAAEPLGLDPRGYLWPRASPEGDRLAFAVQTGRASSLHVRDLARRVTERLDMGGFFNGVPEWSPDGVSVAFSSDREDGVANLYRMAADGSGEPERLAPSDQSQFIMSWSSEGMIAHLQGGDIWMLPPAGEPAPFFTSDAVESHATFSPDGHWLAYRSNQTGRGEVYVRPYPGPGSPTLISGDGGTSPAWSRDGRQIYFVQAGPTSRMMVAAVLPGNEFRAGRAVPLIDPWPYGITSPARNYDVLDDGSFVVSGDEEEVAGGETVSASRRMRFRVREFHVILNFFEELKARVPN